MKKDLTLWITLLAISCFGCCSCYAGGQYRREIKMIADVKRSVERSENSADNDVAKFLGPGRLAVIRTPDRVETYQIDWSRKPRENAPLIQGYPVIARGRDLNNKQTGTVKTIIEAASSYEFQRSKRTRIRPSYILRFVQGADQVDIAIDRNSRQWAFYHRGRIIEEDITRNSALPALSKILDSLFRP